MMYSVFGILPANLSQADKSLVEEVRTTAETLEELIARGDDEELAEYLEDVCDVEIKIGGDFKYRSVELQIAFGGPNMYLDTATCKIKGYWGFGDSFYAEVSDDVADAVDDYFENYYEDCR